MAENKNPDAGKIKITGVKSIDGLSLNGKVVTVSASALGTSKVTISDDYTLALSSNVSSPKTVAASYKDGVYTTKGTTAGYTLSADKKSISYVAGTSKEFKFSGIAEGATAENFYLSGKTMTVGKAAVQTNGTPVKLLTDGYVLRLGRGMDEAQEVSANYDAKTGTYTIASPTAGYTLSDDKKSISYVAGTSKKLKFSGIAEGATADDFYLSGKTMTVGKAAVKTDGTPVKLLTDGYTLKLGRGMDESKSVSANYDAKTGTYITSGITGSYTLSEDKKTITCVTAGTSKEFKLSGIAEGATAENFYLKDKTLTIGKAAVQTDGTPVKLLTNGYTLKLGRGMDESQEITANYDTKTGTYITAGTTAGYKLSADKKTISYVASTSKTFEFLGDGQSYLTELLSHRKNDNSWQGGDSIL